MNTLNADQIHTLDWNKGQGLIPAIVQDSTNNKVLMLGYVSAESLNLTFKTQKVTFYSRSKKALWTKGETSGHFLNFDSVRFDCDSDALLIRANPVGPVCHKGTESCFGEDNISSTETRTKRLFLEDLEDIIAERFLKKPEGSYVTKLLTQGLDRVIQKVGEESVETVIAAKNTDLENFENEVADLVFHLMILMKSKGTSLSNISEILRKRNKAK